MGWTDSIYATGLNALRAGPSNIVPALVRFVSDALLPYGYDGVMPSKAIRAHTYDETRNELTVTFIRGPTYVYSLVLPAVVAAFEASPSKGAFHNANIRDRYPFRKIKAVVEESPGSLLEQLRASS